MTFCQTTGGNGATFRKHGMMDGMTDGQTDVEVENLDCALGAFVPARSSDHLEMKAQAFLAVSLK